MPVVAVEIAPPEPPRALAAALIDACSSSVESGRCSIAAQGTDPGAVRATVAWESALHLRVFVDVTIPGGLTHEPRHRTLDFGPSDAEEERFRAVGLTIATLSSELQRAESEARAAAMASTEPAGTASPSATASPPEMPRPETQAPKGSDEGPGAAAPDRTQPSPRHRLWATASGVLAPALSDGTLRYGGGLEIGVRPTEGPWFVALGGAVSFRSRDAQGVAGQWKEVVARLGVSFGFGPLSLEPSIGAGFQTLDLDIEDPATSARDSGDSENLGVYLGVLGSYAVGPVAFVLGLDGHHFPRQTDILVRDHGVGASRATSFSANLGIRVFLE